MHRNFEAMRHTQEMVHRLQSAVRWGYPRLLNPRFWRGVFFYLSFGFVVVPSLVGHFAPELLTQTLKTPVSLGTVKFNPLTLGIGADDVEIRSEDHSGLIHIGHLGIDLNLFATLWYREPCFDQIMVKAPELDLHDAKNGSTNFSNWIHSVSAPAPDASSSKEAQALPRIRIDRFRLEGGRFEIHHATDKPDQVHRVDHIQLELDDISTHPGTTGLYHIAARLEETGDLSWQGSISLAPFQSEGEFDVHFKDSPKLSKLMAEALGTPQIKGDIKIQGHYSVETEPQIRWQLREVSFLADHLQTLNPGAGIARAEITEAKIQGLAVESAARHIRVESASLSGALVELAPPFSPASDHSDTSTTETKRITAQSRSPKMEPGFGAWELELNHAGVSKLTVNAKAPPCPPQSQPDSSAHTNAPKPSAPQCQNPASMELATLNQALLDGMKLDLGQKSIRIEKIDIQEPSVALIRSLDGSFAPLSRREKADEFDRANSGSANGQAWQFSLKRGLIQGGSLHLEQRLRSEAFAFDLERIDAALNETLKGNEVHLSASLRQGGSLDFGGTYFKDSDTSQAALKVQRLNLLPLQGFLSHTTSLQLEEAQLNLDLSLSAKAPFPPKAPEVKGTASVENLSLLKGPKNLKFFTLKGLKLTGIQAVPTEKKFRIKELKLMQPDAVVAIRIDKKSNLSDIADRIRATSSEEVQSDSIPTGTSPDKPGSKPGTLSFGIDRIAIEKGRVDYSDQSLIIPFASQIHQLNGVITGVESNPESEASLRIFGAVGEYGEASLEGRLRPAAPKDFTDITLAFRNVQMSTLSPYSATFAGRKIESGKFNVNTHYQSQSGEFKSENKVFLEHLNLGEPIESPKSVSLPLDLAVNILSDSEGNIATTIPVQGNFNDPEFDYGSLLLDAISNLLKRAVTAPFSLLSAIFEGADDQNLGKIHFHPGESRLIPPERERLMQLTEKLKSKKNLSLIIHGGSLEALDAIGLKKRRVRESVDEALGTFPASVEADPINVSAAKTQRVLENLGTQLDLIDSTIQRFEEETGRPPDRVNLLTSLLDRPSKTPDFYQALLEAIEKSMPLPEEALSTLGHARAEAILRELVDVLHFDPHRLHIGPPVTAEGDDDQMVVLTLELEGH